MHTNHSKAGNKLRLEIAQVAARFIAVDGINDLYIAKRKAALHMGLNPERNMPTNREVEQALMDYQSIFLSEKQNDIVFDMRSSAIKAMRLMSEFRPKLVGPVLKGTATRYSDITLHVYTDQTEQIGFKLDDHGIPYETHEKSIRVNTSEHLDLPAYKFMANDYSFVLLVFSEKQKNLSPMSSSTGRSMDRSSLKQLETIISQGS